MAFLVGWMIIFSGVVGAATVSLGFAGYFQALTGAPILPSAIALLAVLSLVLLFGITHSTRLAIVLTTMEAQGLVLVIYMGIPYLGSVDLLEMSPLSGGGILQASALIFFAIISIIWRSSPPPTPFCSCSSHHPGSSTTWPVRDPFPQSCHLSILKPTLPG